MTDDFPECTEDDLKPIMICMRIDELNRMHESKDPELFHALFGSLQDDEVQEAYMDLVERESKAKRS
jgi:hypothetical protein